MGATIKRLWQYEHGNIVASMHILWPQEERGMQTQGGVGEPCLNQGAV